jgi:hypothetical protein
MLAVAMRAWNLMDGAIDWAALPIIIELLGVDDVEALVVHLQLIRQRKSDA